MFAAALFVLLAASATAAPVEPWWGEVRPEYQCGGTQAGQYFSYMSSYQSYGFIRKVEVWAGDYVDAVRFTHGNAPEGPKIGGLGGVLQGNFVLNQNEYITGINIEKQAVSGGEAICRISFSTSFARYGPYGSCTHNGVCGERTFTGPLQYVSVNYAANIIAMSFTF